MALDGGKRLHTVNELAGEMARRASELSAMKVGELRLMHPDNIGEEAPVGYNRGECIEAILYEEFSQVFDVQLVETIVAYINV